MCAIDGRGIMPLLDLPVDIDSRDPVSGGEIRLGLGPGGSARWEPETAIVLWRRAMLNFFEPDDTAALYLGEHPELTSRPPLIPEASETGRLVLGAILRDPAAPRLPKPHEPGASRHGSPRAREVDPE